MLDCIYFIIMPRCRGFLAAGFPSDVAQAEGRLQAGWECDEGRHQSGQGWQESRNGHRPV